MKSKFIIITAILLFVAIQTISAQCFIGVKAGAGAGNIRFSPSQETEYYMPTMLGGFTFRYYGGDKFFGGIEADLLYQEKGYKVLPRMDSDSAYIRTVTQIQLPFLWQPHVAMLKNKVHLFFNLGPYIGYNLSSREMYVTKELGTLYDREYVMDSERDNRFEFGLAFGAGFSVAVAQRIDIVLDARYNLGLTDLLKSSVYYSDNPYLSPSDFVAVTLGLSYKFGAN